MPLFKTINHGHHTTVLVWHIVESEEELSSGVVLKKASRQRLRHMKSELHRRGFLSVRHLLLNRGYTDEDLFYTADGKPHLNDGKRISITHSFEFSAIAISDNSVGIDIEKNREKIKRIAPKFVAGELDFLDEKHAVEFLTVIWGAKESLFKIHPDGGLLFKEHLPIESFNLADGKTRGWIKKDDFYEVFNLYFQSFKGFTMVFAVND